MGDGEMRVGRVVRDIGVPKMVVVSCVITVLPSNCKMKDEQSKEKDRLSTEPRPER
jgi:hypothetical protein